MRVARWLAFVGWSFALTFTVGCQSVLGDFTLETASEDAGIDSSLASIQDGSSVSGSVDGSGGDGQPGNDGSAADGNGLEDSAPPFDGHVNGTCGATTCPDGCCAAGNVCLPYANQSNGSCGAAGVTCNACTGLQQCDTTTGLCGCTAHSCASGCCDTNHNCEASGDPTCGANGSACADCTTNGQECVGGSCQCDATSCPHGCCDTNSVCQSNGVNTCGLGGASCKECVPGQSCGVEGASNAGQCECAVGCAGCCSGGPTGACVGGSEPATCGFGGATCADCTMGQGQECAKNGADNYACICDSTSCSTGCCDTNNNCQANAAPNCGTHGASCVTGCDATEGQRCNAAGACVCDVISCSDGCCTSATGTCVTARTYSQCALNGDVCGTCANSTYTCSSDGACVCPSGEVACGGSCINPATNGTYCGATGNCTGVNAGTGCTEGKTCQSGVCACPSGGIVCGGACTVVASDPSNCGTCGHSCGPSATCSGGACQPVAVCTYTGGGSGDVSDLTINGAGIAGFAWNIAGSSGAIVSCNTSTVGQTVGALFALSVAPTGITSDSQSFYWTNENAGTISSGKLSGGSVTTLLTLGGGANPVGIAPATAGVFVGTGTGGPAFFYADGANGTVDLYANGSSSQCISGMSFPYFIGGNDAPLPDGGAPSKAWIAASDVTGNAVYAVPTAGCGTAGAQITIATGVPGADTAATDGADVFFGTRGNSTTPAALYACPTSGCSPVSNPTPYVANQGTVGRVAVDGSNVIWSANGGILECAKTGCTTPTAVVPNTFTNALVAQNGFIYYVYVSTLYYVAE